jgi:hypothetical protein
MIQARWRPTLVTHADWSVNGAKRWMVRATLRDDGRYDVHTPELVGELSTLIERMQGLAAGGAAVLGFDFPLGLPLPYAERAGIGDFLAVLPKFGQAEWAAFYEVAERQDEINLRRPFYPRRAGGTRHHHLTERLEVETMNDLRRRCDMPTTGRRAASPLFWTLGGQQVGKATICGWRDVVAPALRSGIDVAVWPFAGRFFDLLRPGRVVLAESYPAEYYGHLGISFRPSSAGQKWGKRVQAARQTAGQKLLAWAGALPVELSPGLRDAIERGFGARTDGEDQFDAAVGCFGMLNVVLGNQPAGDPDDERVRRIEGWILGQTLVLAR